MSETSPPSPTNDRLFPERLGRYRIVRPISTGGMARVFEARRESLAGVSPRVALKVILPDFAADETFQALFVNEARVGSQLQHQNLVQIQDFDREDDVFYIVMEFVDGVTLRRSMSLCRRHGLAVPVSVVAEIGRQAAEGLHFAHTVTDEHGTPLHLVHRDMKPSNIMLNNQGVVKLVDFGVSKALFNRERAGSVRGTWGYMSPEQAAGADVAAAADVFGLAAVIYELAALQPLFPEKKPEEIRPLLMNDEAARRAATLAGPYGPLAPLLIRALQRDPSARFPNARAFSRALATLVPDAVTAREQTVQFYTTIETMRGGSGARGQNSENRSRPPTAGSMATGSKHSAEGSLASGVHASANTGARGSAYQAPSKSGGTRTSRHGGGLPLAVGALPRHMTAESAPSPLSNPRVRASLYYALMATALCIVLFTAWRILVPPAAEPITHPATVEQPFEIAPVIADQPAAIPEGDEVPHQQPIESVSEPAPSQTNPQSTKAKRPSPPTKRASKLTTDVSSTTAETAAADASGLLTVSSIPRSKVILDGQYLRYAPVFQYEVPAGVHTVTLVTDDGRRTHFKVDIVADKEWSRVWHFDNKDWVGQ